MKLDHEYIKGLLEAFEISDEPHTNIYKLKDAGFPYEDNRFIFHLYILRDQDLIQPVRQSDFTLGYSLGLNGHVIWSVLPIRLTAQGHDYLSDLRQIPVWEQFKEDFKEASIETTIDMAKQLSIAWAKNKLEGLLPSRS